MSSIAPPGSLKFLNAATQTTKSNEPSGNGVCERIALPHVDGHAGSLRMSFGNLDRAAERSLPRPRRHFKALPSAEYPNLVALADDLTEDAQDELFEFGIEMCLRGIEARIKITAAR